MAEQRLLTVHFILTAVEMEALITCTIITRRVHHMQT